MFGLTASPKKETPMLATSLSPLIHQVPNDINPVFWIIPVVLAVVAAGFLIAGLIREFKGSSRVQEFIGGAGLFAILTAVCVFALVFVYMGGSIDARVATDHNHATAVASWLHTDYGIRTSSSAARTLLDHHRVVLDVHGAPTTLALVSAGNGHVVPINETTNVPIVATN
jgi:uncharacterized membrane protein YraQ (UPF0718 family)